MANEIAIGTVKRPRDIPLDTKDLGLYIYVACVDCGLERWVQKRSFVKGHQTRCGVCARKFQNLIHGEPRKGSRQTEETKRKISKATRGVPKSFTKEQRQALRERMTGKNNPNWTGQPIITGFGYLALTLYPDDHFFPMAAKNHHVLEHRLVMAKHIGRCLEAWEVVHHINGIKTDNRIENLKLLECPADHLASQKIQLVLSRQAKEIEELRMRVIQLEKLLLAHSLREVF